MSDKKIKEVEKPKIPEQVQESYRPRKEGQSTFDRILEQNRQLQKSPTNTQQTTVDKSEHQETRVARHQEQGERGRDRQDDDKEKDRVKEKAKDERRSEADTSQRVSGRGSKKGSSGSGGKGGGRQDGYGGKTAHRKSALELKKGAFARGAAGSAEASKFADKLKMQMQSASQSREMIQKIVNQIVKYMKSGINKDGEHEVRLDLNDRIFRGLRLRVALKDGKVSVHFGSEDADVRKLFRDNSEKIAEELKNKGIAVTEIKVS